MGFSLKGDTMLCHPKLFLNSKMARIPVYKSRKEYTLTLRALISQTLMGFLQFKVLIRVSLFVTPSYSITVSSKTWKKDIRESPYLIRVKYLVFYITLGAFLLSIDFSQGMYWHTVLERVEFIIVQNDFGFEFSIFTQTSWKHFFRPFFTLR
jgi:hypothetical protein